MSDLTKDIERMKELIEDSEERLNIAIEVLEFYAKSKNWDIVHFGNNSFSTCEADEGKLARQALQKLERSDTESKTSVRAGR